MKNTITTTLATISTIVPEVAEQFDPTVVTEGASLIVQVVTAIIAVIGFFKGIFKKKQPIINNKK